MTLHRSYEMRDVLEELFPTVVEIDFTHRNNFDFHNADRWCRDHIGRPDYFARNAIQDGRVGWRLEPIEGGSGWCTFQNTYFFRNASDALMFKLSL